MYTIVEIRKKKILCKIFNFINKEEEAPEMFNAKFLYN